MPVVSYVYDANGWKTWCLHCGAPLNHRDRARRARAGSPLLAFLVLVAATLITLLWFFWMFGVWP